MDNPELLNIPQEINAARGNNLDKLLNYTSIFKPIGKSDNILLAPALDTK